MSRNKHFRRGTGQIATCTNCGEDIQGSDKAAKSRTYKVLGETTWEDKSGNDLYKQYHSHYEPDYRGSHVYEAGPHCNDCAKEREETSEQESSAYWDQQMRDTDRDWWQ